MMNAYLFKGIFFAVIAAVVGAVILFKDDKEGSMKQSLGDNSGFLVSSAAFKNNGFMPKRYSCDGEGILPPFSIRNVPDGAKSLAVISDDPDAPAGVWVHWVEWNIPPEMAEIKEGEMPAGAAGKNSWNKTGYGPPCPPFGVHRYFFKVYALDVILDLPEGSSAEELEKAMSGHILAKSELIGLYQREK